MFFYLSLIVCLLILSALHSLCEAVILRMSNKEMIAVLKQKSTHKLEKKLLDYLALNSEKILSVVLWNNGLINIMLGIYGTTVSLKIVQIWAIPAVIVIPVNTCFFLFIILICSEITPKLMGYFYAKKILRYVLNICIPLTYIAYPIVKVFVKIALILVQFISKETSQRHQDEDFKKENLKKILMNCYHTTNNEAQHSILLKNVLEAQSVSIKFVQTPIEKVFSLPIDCSLEEMVQRFNQKSLDFFMYSQIPVYKDDIYHIHGVICAGDLLSAWYHKDIILVSDIVRDVPFLDDHLSILKFIKYYKIHSQNFFVIRNKDRCTGVMKRENIFGLLNDKKMSEDSEQVIQNI